MNSLTCAPSLELQGWSPVFSCSLSQSVSLPLSLSYTHTLSFIPSLSICLSISDRARPVRGWDLARLTPELDHQKVSGEGCPEACRSSDHGLAPRSRCVAQVNDFLTLTPDLKMHPNTSLAPPLSLPPPPLYTPSFLSTSSQPVMYRIVIFVSSFLLIVGLSTIAISSRVLFLSLLLFNALLFVPYESAVGISVVLVTPSGAHTHTHIQMTIPVQSSASPNAFQIVVRSTKQEG